VSPVAFGPEGRGVRLARLGMNGCVRCRDDMALDVRGVVDAEARGAVVGLPRVTGEIGGVFEFLCALHRPAGRRAGRIRCLEVGAKDNCFRAASKARQHMPQDQGACKS
jgi:hypothetical protein